MKKYTASELWNKHCLEHLFWIEVAKRKSALEEPEAFAALLALHTDIEEAIGRQQPIDREPLEIDAGTVLDFAQFEWDIEGRAISEAVAQTLDVLLATFDHRIEGVKTALAYCHGFRLADFSLTTDLMQLDWWWRYITSKEGREELGTTDSVFSSTGRLRPVAASEAPPVSDGDSAPTAVASELMQGVITLVCPIAIPVPVTTRKIWHYDTDSHNIAVNDQPIHDRVVLAFDIEKPLPSMHEVEQVLRIAHGLARSNRFFTYLEQGVLREDLLSREDDGLDMEARLKRHVPTRPEDHRMFKKVNSFRPTILGLSCWDHVRQGVTVERACAETARAFEASEDSVANGLKKMKALIQSYKPTQLPWNS